MFTDVVKMGKKGQITLPKEIRDDEDYQEGDEFFLTHMPGGDVTLHKKTIGTPEDRLLELIKTLPKINWRKAWKEVEEERSHERT